MQKWEYMSLLHGWNNEEGKYYWDDDQADERNPIERLNELGKKGWELASSHSFGALLAGNVYILKRPIK